MPKGGRPPRRGWQDKWLQGFIDTHMVSEACKKAAVSRAYAYDQRRKDPDFAAAWEAVEDASTEILEQIATRRAAEGSDQLMMFLLKARRPEMYRENVHVDHEHAHVVSGEITLKALIGGAQPIQIEAAKRREAARLLLMGEADVVEGTAEDLPNDDYEDLPEVETDLVAAD